MKFQTFTTNFYAELLPLMPEVAALKCGKEEFAGQITNYSDESRAKYANLIFQTLPKAKALIANNKQQKLEQRLLIGFLELESYKLQKNDERYTNPTMFLPFSFIENSINYPFENRKQAIENTLKNSAKLLQIGSELIQTSPEKVVAKFLDNALNSLTSGIDYLNNLDKNPTIKKYLPDEGDLANLIENIIKQAENFYDVLSQIKPQAKGNFAVGKEHFDLILQHQHHTPLNHAQIYEIGENLFKQISKQINQLQVTINSAKTDDNNFPKLPQPQEVIPLSKKYWKEITGFVKEKDLLTLPKNENLVIKETPDFLKATTPFARIVTPGIFNKKQTSYYFITTPKNQQDMEAWSREAIITTVAHEGLGHHIKATANNKNKKDFSVIKAITPSGVNYEGWALYCEQMLLDEGYRATPERQMVILKDRLWRALRIMLDVQIQCYNQPFEEAVNEMVEKLGFTKQQAEAYLSWYIMEPGVPMGYLTGYVMLNAAKNAVKGVKKHNFCIKNFHNEFLTTGEYALPLCIEQVFGERVKNSCIAKLRRAEL